MSEQHPRALRVAGKGPLQPHAALAARCDGEVGEGEHVGQPDQAQLEHRHGHHARDAASVDPPLRLELVRSPRGDGRAPELEREEEGAVEEVRHKEEEEGADAVRVAGAAVVQVAPARRHPRRKRAPRRLVHAREPERRRPRGGRVAAHRDEEKVGEAGAGRLERVGGRRAPDGADAALQRLAPAADEGGVALPRKEVERDRAHAETVGDVPSGVQRACAAVDGPRRRAEGLLAGH
mmetsp:Transcript_12642/g.37123  ORF Transcript_12642/g.37123 Transcript_12642/m.37123 type:complete len:236 (-) Transcript_12642:32-739(-)